MKAAAKRPATLHVGKLHVRPRRGPDAAGLWYWRADWYSDGKDHALALGWLSPKDAERKAARMVADGTAEAPKAEHVEEVSTVRDLLETWIGDHVDRAGTGNMAPATASMYKARAKHLCAGIGDVRLDRVSVVTLEGHRDGRLRAGTAPRTVAHELLSFRIAWNWGGQRGHCPDRRLPSVDIKIRNVNNHRTPTREEVGRVLDVLDGWPRLAVHLLAGTGARIGEVTALRWRDVDLDGGWIRVDGKTGERDVPIAAEVVAALVAAGPRGADDLVLPVARSTARTALQTVHITRACKAAGVERFTAHGLRRLASITLADAGVDIATYAAILGHSPEVAIRNYQEVTPDRRNRAAASARLGTFGNTGVVPFRARS